MIDHTLNSVVKFVNRCMLGESAQRRCLAILSRDDARDVPILDYQSDARFARKDTLILVRNNDG